MTLNKLASLISKKEGKKHQASIGDIREIIGVLVDIIREDGGSEVYMSLIGMGNKRAKRAKAKRGKS